jgi:LmbE family N-acetylglucosaminyl deacetylase
MLPLVVRNKAGLNILCLGAHCDDIEIGCGGTILRLIEEHIGKIVIHWVVFSSGPDREREAVKSAQAFLKRSKHHAIVVHHFPDSFFPYSGAEIKKSMHQLSREFSPDLVFTHCRHDLHQDHRLISELTWNAFRDHLILEYEIPKYDGDLSACNLFVPLTQSICRKKTTHILKFFKSQTDKSWFTKETFTSLLRLRGIECNSSSGYAEGFYCRKIVL